MKTLSLIIATLSVFLILGCASMNTENSSPSIDNRLVAQTYHAADVLISQAGLNLAPNKPLLIATIVDIDNLEKSSTFGRITSENLSTRFCQAGLKVIEMKFSKSVYMKRNEGEMVLTREIDEVVRDYDVQAVVVGTYGKTNNSLYVNLKLVKPGTNIISASYDYVMRMDDDIRALMRVGD